MNAKIGRDTPFIGDMRRRLVNGKPVALIETSDAGALFRFTDVYPRMYGGRISIGLDPPGPSMARRRTASSASTTSRSAASRRSIRWCRARRTGSAARSSSSRRKRNS